MTLLTKVHVHKYYKENTLLRYYETNYVICTSRGIHVCSFMSSGWYFHGFLKIMLLLSKEICPCFTCCWFHIYDTRAAFQSHSVFFCISEKIMPINYHVQKEKLEFITARYKKYRNTVYIITDIQHQHNA